MEREQLYPSLLKDLQGTYVEIGSCWGGFAELLLEKTPCTKLYCVDPYKVFPDHIYFDALNKTTQEQLNQKFSMVSQRLQNNKMRKPVEMVRLTSYEAAKLIPDDLSFVYIDGNHHHREVLKDLVMWWPKLKVGGYICGDDVEDINIPHHDGDLYVEHCKGSFGVYGVATALADFAKAVPNFRYAIEGNQFVCKKY